MKHTPPLPTVMILGGAPDDRAAMGRALAGAFECLEADRPGDAWTLMSDHFVQVIICAGVGSGTESLEIGRTLVDHWPETVLIVVSDGTAAVDAAPNLHQILTFPWTAEQLRRGVSAAARVFQLTRENERMALELRCKTASARVERHGRNTLGFEGILRVPGSPMSALIERARQYATFDVPVLIVGEGGTGKATLARAMHDASMRSDADFVALDVTGMTDVAAFAALFGADREPGRTVGEDRRALIRDADGGTLFIAGLERASRDLQLRLLRLARDGEFECDTTKELEPCAARLIAAMNVDPAQAIAAGQLVPELYYALSIAELTVPPLRTRKVDIPLLARATMEEASRVHGKTSQGLSDEALTFLARYPWPGNQQELQNEITRMLILAQEPVLGPEVISRHILQADPGGEEDVTDAQIMVTQGPLKDRIEAIEARILLETLTRLRWNKSRSAEELGLSRVGLRAKLDRYGINPPHKEEA